LFLSRAFSSGRGPATNTISGMGPPETRTVVLRAAGREQRISTYDSGERWEHLVFFNAPVDGRDASAEALDQQGKVLATASEK
jgi:hypothetical protein